MYHESASIIRRGFIFNGPWLLEIVCEFIFLWTDSALWPPVVSCVVLLRGVLSCVILCYLSMACLVLYYFVLCDLVLSCLVLSGRLSSSFLLYVVGSSLVLTCVVLSWCVLSGLVLWPCLLMCRRLVSCAFGRQIFPKKEILCPPLMTCLPFSLYSQSWSCKHGNATGGRRTRIRADLTPYGTVCSYLLLLYDLHDKHPSLHPSFTYL